MAKYDYRISVSQPRTIVVGKGMNRTPVATQDVFTRFVYGVPSKADALRTFASRPNFKLLRSQGLKVSRSTFLADPKIAKVERIPKGSK